MHKVHHWRPELPVKKLTFFKNWHSFKKSGTHSLELYYKYFLPDFALSLDAAMRLPSQCIRFEESIIFLEGVMNSDFAHTSIIYHEHIDFLCINEFTSN